MSDLSGKFDDLKVFLETQHEELMEALGNIVELLGGTPPTETTTLEDVVNAINEGNSRLFALIGVSNGISIDTSNIDATASAIKNDTAAIKASSASILSFLQSANFCCDEETPELFPPPLSETPVPNSLVKCQNVQLALDILISISVYIQQLIDAPIAPTSSQIAGLYAGDSRLDNCPKPAQVEVNVILSNIMLAKDANLTDLPSRLADLAPVLRNVLYSGSNAQNAWESWQSILDLLVSNIAARELIRSMFYNGLFNCLFSNTSGLDGSSYDGDLCEGVVVDCTTVESVTITASPDGGYPNRQQGVFVSLTPVESLELSPGVVVTYSAPAIMTSGIAGGTLSYVSGQVRIVYGVSGVSNFVQFLVDPDDVFELPPGINYLILDDYQGPGLLGSGEFEVEFCPADPI